MAVSFLEDPHCRFEKTAIISNIEHLPVSSKATELTVADDKKSNECNHFTIRGYVAEVRKRNSENCFPFLLHKCASVECSNAFPPLPVVKFRRWGCPNCVYEIIATTGQMDIGGARSIHNKDVKSNNNLLLGKEAESSQLDAREVFSKLSQNLKENHLKEMFEVKDFNVSRVRKEGNKCRQGDLIKEGVQKYKNGRNNTAQFENAIEVGCFSYGHNVVNKGRRGKQRNSTDRKKLGVAYVKDALNTALVKHKRAKLHKVGHSKMLDGDSTSIRNNFSVCCSEEDQGPKRKRDENIASNDFRQGHAKVDMFGEKNDVLEADPAHTSCLGTCCQDKRTCGVSVDGPKYTGLTDGEHQLEDEHLHFKKIRKVRLLEDIIRSEKPHTTGSRNMLDEDAKAIQYHLVSDSSTKKKASMEVWEKVSKKPRSKRNTDQEALDDIPMDIVELLARNQHERFHLLAKTDSTNKLKLPAKTESIKRFDFDPSQISKNIVVDAEQGNLSCQHVHANNKGFDVRSTFPCNGDKECEPKDCSCSINGKRKLQIDLSQHHSNSLIDGAGFCNDINVNCHQLNFSCCRSNNMYSSQSCLREQTTGGENLVGNLHYDALQHRKAASFGVRYPFCNNSNASVLGSNLELFAQSGGYEKLRNTVGNHHYCGFSSTAPNASSFMNLANGLANGCRSNFSPADLYSNETISALNLLRLMDQAAWSGESRTHFQSCSGFIKESDMGVHGQHNEWQLENGRQEKGTCMCPLEVVTPITRQQSRTPCLLFRPLPRIGSLGPSVQKEILSYSNFNSIPTRNSHGLFKTNSNGRIESSHLNPNTYLCNSHNSRFRCKCSEKIYPDGDPDRCSTSSTRCSVTKAGATRVELNNKVDALLPLGSFYKMEICVVNRNPAEFTVLDENNEYMTEIKKLKIKSLSQSLRGPLHSHKKQRVMKLNDLKSFAMG